MKSLHPKLSRTGTLTGFVRQADLWMAKAFSFSTDSAPFEQLDEFVGEQISDYEAIVGRVLLPADDHTPPLIRMIAIGIPSTHSMFLAAKKPVIS